MPKNGNMNKKKKFLERTWIIIRRKNRFQKFAKGQKKFGYRKFGAKKCEFFTANLLLRNFVEIVQLAQQKNSTKRGKRTKREKGYNINSKYANIYIICMQRVNIT